MPNMSFSYRMRGHKKFQSSLKKLSSSLDDMKEPLDEAGIYMHKSIDDNFKAGGRPKWKKHAPLTKKLRPGGEILQDTGQLRGSVTGKGAGSKYNLKKNSLVIGSNVKTKGGKYKLADIQQNGADIKIFGKGKGKIPPRPFLMFQKEDVATIQKIFDDFIDRKL